MIKIYYTGSCSSSKKVFYWMDKHNIVTEQLKISHLSPQDLFHLLTLSELGIEEIIKRRSTLNDEASKKIQHLEKLSFKSAVIFLLENKELLKTPIVLEKNKYMIGYQIDNIRQFLPAEYRNRTYY